MDSDVNLLLGFTETLLALIVLLPLGRFWRSFPWLAALMIFFFARGLGRIYVGTLGHEPLIAPVITDSFLIAVVVLLILGMRRTVLTLRHSIEDAEWRKSEYERALTDYRALVRHRLANPLTIVMGGVELLRRAPARTHEEKAILDDVYLGVRRLEQVSVEAEPLSAEEEGLHPKPELPL